MLLTSYIQDKDRKAALAAACGTSGDYLWQLATAWNGRKPSPQLARRIAEATGGAVSLSELRPDIWPDEQAA